MALPVSSTSRQFKGPKDLQLKWFSTLILIWGFQPHLFRYKYTQPSYPFSSSKSLNSYDSVGVSAAFSVGLALLSSSSSSSSSEEAPPPPSAGDRPSVVVVTPLRPAASCAVLGTGFWQMYWGSVPIIPTSSSSCG